VDLKNTFVGLSGAKWDGSDAMVVTATPGGGARCDRSALQGRGVADVL
jgi:hypothetical protein